MFMLWFFFKILFIYFLGRGEGREKKRVRNIDVWLPLVCPFLGAWPATQHCSLTGNGTRDPLVCRLALNPLSLTSQGNPSFLTISASLWKTDPAV